MSPLRIFSLLGLATLFVSVGSAADKPDAKDAKAKTFDVPYKMTLPKHIVVRLKFNGKGPFNFILDTGAPALIVATKVGKKAGLEVNENGWATIDKLEVEGGIVMKKVKARVETPFQLEGMNGMGLAGLEIHGLMGYQSLAMYRMEIDFTRDKMRWTELNYKPELALGMGGKGTKGGSQGGLEVMGSIMKTLGGWLGRRPSPEIVLRGFTGITLADGDGHPVVKEILEKGPAGVAGLKAGDIVTKVQDRSVYNVEDVMRLGKRIPPGAKMILTIKRDKDTKEISFIAPEGI